MAAITELGEARALLLETCRAKLAELQLEDNDDSGHLNAVYLHQHATFVEFFCCSCRGTTRVVRVSRRKIINAMNKYLSHFPYLKGE